MILKKSFSLISLPHGSGRPIGFQN